MYNYIYRYFIIGKIRDLGENDKRGKPIPSPPQHKKMCVCALLLQ